MERKQSQVGISCLWSTVVSIERHVYRRVNTVTDGWPFKKYSGFWVGPEVCLIFSSNIKGVVRIFF